MTAWSQKAFLSGMNVGKHSHLHNCIQHQTLTRSIIQGLSPTTPKVYYFQYYLLRSLKDLQLPPQVTQNPDLEIHSWIYILDLHPDSIGEVSSPDGLQCVLVAASQGPFRWAMRSTSQGMKMKNIP